MRNPSQSKPIGPLLRRASRLANRLYRQELQQLGLTTRQASAILALCEEPGMTLRRLAETLGSDQATASVLVDRLIAAQLFTRVADPVDRRRVHLYPTEQALSLAERLEPARHASERLIEEALGVEDSQTLRRLLGKLQASLEDLEATATVGGRAVSPAWLGPRVGPRT